MFMTASEKKNLTVGKVYLTDNRFKMHGKKFAFAGVCVCLGTVGIDKRTGKKAIDRQRNQKIADNFQAIIELQRKLG